jgi:hypothetical protein
VNLFGVDPTDDRLRIRALRALPRGRAALDESRRRVFAAALGQFDELLDAAASVGPASRPLPLYYALSQAGAAIAAALQEPGRKWRPGSHGLIIGDPDPTSLGQTTIRSNPVKRRGEEEPSDTFSILCEVLRQPRLTRPTTISNVWAAIPGLEDPGLGAGCPRALPLEVLNLPDPVLTATLRRQRGLVSGAAGEKQLKRMIRRNYPAVADGLVIDDILAEPTPVDGARAFLAWEDPEGSRKDVRRLATEYLGGFWMLPALNQRGETLSPMLLWWCLLYALSDLARYHPADWTAALDPDHAHTAVPIERALSIALAVVPRLVLETLVPGAYPRG